LLLPHQRPVVLAPERRLADGSILTASGLSLDSTCTATHPTAGTAEVRDISLFGGAVTARVATMSLAGGTGSVAGLTVSGRPVTLTATHPIRIGNWGYVIAPDPSAASKSAFEVELSSPHAGLPAGTLVFVPYAQIVTAPPAPQTTTAAPPATTTTPITTPELTLPSGAHGTVPPKRHKRKPGHRPLTITPPLHGGPYVFPVGGEATFGDTYGALRTDVPGNWHHGDDIFAPLGTPVVAVADGSLNRVGWERLGGWRLWVRDKNGDEFYYAHLSGYSPLALKGGTVHRGDVIGFIGNTGDAFTTLPHLHFEIHPRPLLHLNYDGAVNPTRYLDSWPRPGKLHAPHPVHPRLPLAADWRHEARVNFRELLQARGLARNAAPRPAEPTPTPPAIRPFDPTVVAAPAPAPRRSSTGTIVWGTVDAAFAIAAGVGFALWWRRARRAKEVDT
jgi:murein DD-endopeptidase MepM/ murein hydrolase activator NlpD